MTPGGSQAWKSHARFPHPQPSDDRGVYDFLPGLLAKTTRWHNGRTRHSQNPNSEEVFQDCLTKWEESAAHSILARSDQLQQRPNTFAQTNLSISLFACDKAADHTFRVAQSRDYHVIARIETCRHFSDRPRNLANFEQFGVGEFSRFPQSGIRGVGLDHQITAMPDHGSSTSTSLSTTRPGTVAVLLSRECLRGVRRKKSDER